MLLALGATLELANSEGATQTVSLEDFFVPPDRDPGVRAVIPLVTPADPATATVRYIGAPIVAVAAICPWLPPKRRCGGSVQASEYLKNKDIVSAHKAAIRHATPQIMTFARPFRAVVSKTTGPGSSNR